MEYYKMQKIELYILLIAIFFSFQVEAEELRALWVPSWDMTCREDINGIIHKASEAGLNTLLVEVRFRGDTFYTPNLKSDQFFNPEQPSLLLREDFDVLQYFIDESANLGLKIYAWLTMYVATTNDLGKSNMSSPWYREPHWITTDVNWQPMAAIEREGAYLDPGLPAVQDYLYNIVMDVSVNYDIAGIHLDYIRYPGDQWGYHPESFARYRNEVRRQTPEEWQRWRCKQVTELVKRIRQGLKRHTPEVELTAAVVADPDRAREVYNQDWLMWLQKGYILRVFPMNYHVNHELFEGTVDKIAIYGYKNQTVMGIRAWAHNAEFTADNINTQIDYTWNSGIWNYALFSSTGINNDNFWGDLIIRRSR
jgi:uncharacterized lipoprotein YddW (UPF0748 family)